MDAQREKALLARVLEEEVYSNINFEPHKDERLLYLEEEVLPTLVPALKDLLSEIAQNRERLKKSDLNPIDWLAQYLMRYNVRHNTYLHSHPYTLLLNKHTRQVRADIEAEKQT
eukprot:TRINITY_DN7121_c0_g1_i1.p1 TRINITY_DN7121_c0_g1~~TRINITY_DN7121_c0_g1_i1.p1  ORF type:complete len:128 (+),score=20.98 TRINITY_DN7121_c0_g1_i1:43-384(+)